MPSGTALPSLSRRALALPPVAVDFGLPPSFLQAINDIQSVASQMRLNRVQFKRIAAMCLTIYRSLGHGDRTPGQRLLLAVHARCPVWQSADFLQGLVAIPEDMDKFERHCIKLGVPQNAVSSADDEKVELEAIHEATTKIILDEPDRLRAMELRNKPAEAFVSHLQTILDKKTDMARDLRQEYIKALRKLAVEAEVLPSSLKIEEVTLNSAHPIASGGFSDVFQGKWGDKVVAVKRSRIFACKNPEEALKQWRREMLLWHQLSHEFVLPLLGVCKEEGPVHSMVSEWMVHGTLKVFLTNPEHEGFNRLILAHQVAKGLQYLHSHAPPVAHGDIKAANIYIGPDMCPRIGDFGLSCNHYSIDRTLTSTIDSGTVRWMAPELLRPETAGTGRYTQKATPESDIWSFSMLMLEIFTDEDPYELEPEHTVIINITEKKILPKRPARHVIERGLTDAVWMLMEECWKFNSTDRPNVDYVVRNLHRLSLDIRPTALDTRTETELVPVVFYSRAITSHDANWKTLDVKITRERGYVTKNRMRMAAITITGNAKTVAEARLRIAETIKKIELQSTNVQVIIPKQFHGRLVGKKRCNFKRLQKKHGVHIAFPGSLESSAKVAIIGPSTGVEGARVDLEKMVKFERRSRDVIKVTPRAAEIISQRLDELLRPPLREIDVNKNAQTVTLRGKREGIIFAQASIQEIEEEVAREVTQEVPVNKLLHDMIKSDPQTWTDIVDRCGGPVNRGSRGCHLLLDIYPDKLSIRGVPELISSLQKEVGQLMTVSDTCVTSKRISNHRQESLIGSQGKLIKELRGCTGAMVYFPKSGGYAAVGMPNNMDRYEDVDPEDIVKLMGSHDACAKALKYLEDRVEEQRKKEQNSSEYHFRSLGISVESEVPSTPQSIELFVSNDPDRIIGTAPDSSWRIHERIDSEDLLLCQWRLDTTSVTKADDSLQALRKAGDFLTTEIINICKRIGILQLRNSSHLCVVKERLSELCDQDNEVVLELVEKSNRVAIGGPSTAKVQSIINKITALVESLGN